MSLGAVLAAFSLPRWKLDALRDSAIWYYGIFFFIGLALTTREAIADRFWLLIRRIWIISLVWNVADICSRHQLSHSGPIIPWRGVPVLFNATHEAGQNLALGSLIVLCTTTLYRRPFLRSFLALVAALGLALFVISDGRGMRLGFAAALLTMLLLSFGARRRPNFNERLITLMAGALPLVALAALIFSGQVMRLSSLDRFAGVDPSNPDGTANWRLIWWQNLYDHVMETNPAVGIGFGQSLHIYNPLLESDDEEFVVRSPHNFNVTVFTRMGFSGLCLWAGVLIIGVGGLSTCVFRGTVRGHLYTEERRDELAFWTTMLVCTVVNSSFGVLMEGPVLGIWFWFALGFATGRSLTPGISAQCLVQSLGRLILQYKSQQSLLPAEA
jgi:hypothetical protein